MQYSHGDSVKNSMRFFWVLILFQFELVTLKEQMRPFMNSKLLKRTKSGCAKLVSYVVKILFTEHFQRVRDYPHGEKRQTQSAFDSSKCFSSPR